MATIKQKEEKDLEIFYVKILFWVHGIHGVHM